MRSPLTGRGGALAAMAFVVVFAAALRVPFMWTGVGADEGGYAFIAHEWAHGAHLYRDLFVDRPQGLIALYRGLTDVAYAAWAVRLGAVLAGALLTLLVGAAGWMLRSPSTGVAAAAIFAVVGVAPGLEGFTMEGELAAAVPAAAAVVCTLRWRTVGRDRWLLAAGCAGGLAVLMKQSGFDGLLVAFLVVAALAGGPVERARRAALVAAGAAVPLAAAVIHGLVLGWSDYWLGVYGWRAEHDLGRGLGARIADLADVLGRAGIEIAGVAVVAAAGLWIALRNRRGAWVAAAWLGACVLALNAGGLYLPHYFIQLIPPLALLAGIAVDAAYRRSRVLALGLGSVAIAPVVVTLAGFVAMSAQRRETAIRWKGRYDADVQVARFLRAHSTRRDEVYAYPSRADLYFLADRRPPTPYLWEHTPLVRPSTIASIRRRLSRPGRPKFVVMVDNARDIDATGRVRSVVARNYRQVWRPPRGPYMRVLLARGERL